MIKVCEREREGGRAIEKDNNREGEREIWGERERERSKGYMAVAGEAGFPLKASHYEPQSNPMAWEEQGCHSGLRDGAAWVSGGSGVSEGGCRDSCYKVDGKNRGLFGGSLY